MEQQQLTIRSKGILLVARRRVKTNNTNVRTQNSANKNHAILVSFLCCRPEKFGVDEGKMLFAL